MRDLFGVAAVISLVLLGAGPGQAASDCAVWMEAFRVPPPAGPVPEVGETGPDWTCPPDRTAMFLKNYNAIGKADTPAEPEDLYGTWLGDDVLLYVTGAAVPGQEVLRIAPMAAQDGIAVRQLWYKAITAPGTAYPWDIGQGYTGVIAEGVLAPQDQPGTYRARYDAPIRYGGLNFEYERGFDLFVKARINHFQGPVSFSRVGDTLVMTTETMDPLLREPESRIVTYTRVDETAPDLAIMLVRLLNISQARHFECFIHQISDGKGSLIDAMAPLDPEGVVRVLGPLHDVGIRFEATMAMAPPGAPLPKALLAVARSLQEQRLNLVQDEGVKSLTARLLQADLGCPDY